MAWLMACPPEVPALQRWAERPAPATAREGVGARMQLSGPELEAGAA